MSSSKDSESGSIAKNVLILEETSNYHAWLDAIQSFLMTLKVWRIASRASIYSVLELLRFVSLPMVSSYSLCIIELIFFSVCSHMIGYIVCFFWTLLTLLLLSYNPTLSFLSYHQKGYSLLLIFAYCNGLICGQLSSY